MSASKEQIKSLDQLQDHLARVATCCRVSAAILTIADPDDATKAQRKRYRELNTSQATLLRQCADLIDPRRRQVIAMQTITPANERIYLTLESLRDINNGLSAIRSRLQTESNSAWGDLSKIGEQIDDAIDILENGY